MLLIITPITSLSGFVDWSFLITVRESPIIVTEWRSIVISSFRACRPAKASAANGDGKFVWSIVFVAMSPPVRP
ncbi:hypothetical protein PVK06_030750 [Gossypium arboreum]|uniref:Secreted protein n=1 Tax=Gossypium arboreum TaxID=29729 RepID=A0ABR0NRG6_GOSAR|nr:hypothetical protein PVK06_030750 [Gossypium arboreum]